MGNKKKCFLCQKRYVEQQEWKHEEEKCLCQTCLSYLKGLEGLDIFFQQKIGKGIVECITIYKNFLIKYNGK